MPILRKFKLKERQYKHSCLNSAFYYFYLILFNDLYKYQPSKTMDNRYKLPVGLLSSEQELRDRQKELLKQQYEKNISIKKNEKINNPYRRYSERNLINPEHNPIVSNQMVIPENRKDLQIRNILADDLNGQIKEQQRKKKMQELARLQQQKRANQYNRSLMQKQVQKNKRMKEKIHYQLTKDYQEHKKRRQQEQYQQAQQKQRINSRLRAFDGQNINRKKRNITKQTQQMALNSPKIPQYYQQVQSFQNNNLKNYQNNVKSYQDNLNRRYEDIIDERVRQNMRKQRQSEIEENQYRQFKKQQLQRVLQQQIREAEKRSQQMKAYHKAKFYGPEFENVYHPICNPVDSKFCKDNKYVIGEIYMQGEKKKSRESLDRGSSVQINYLNSNQKSSGLAKRGSLALL